MVIVSLFCPKVVPVSDLSALSLCVHFVFMLAMCCLNDMDVSYVTPRILGECVCGMRMLLMKRRGMNLCSAVQLVSSVAVDLFGAILSLFVVNQVLSVSRYGCRISVALSALLCVHVIVMSSA